MKSMPRKAMVGGIVVLGAALAFLLRGIGLELGTGEPAGNQPAPNQTESENGNEGIMADLSPEESVVPVTPPKKTVTKTYPDTSEFITVIVEEKHYLWATNDGLALPVEQLPLSEIVEKAKQTRGNNQGIRVRIFHVGSALPSAENELIDALKTAGLTDLQIHFEQRVIELPQS